MDATKLTLLLIVLAAGAGAAAQIARDWRIDRRFTRLTLLAVAGFFAFGGIGVAVLVVAFGPDDALEGVLFLLLWMTEGLVWLIREAPHRRAPPH